MPEYIKREDMNNTLDEMCVVDGIYNALNAIPAADVVEVVRCKDCAHAVEHKYSPAFYKCNGCGFLRGRLVSSTFWCKCGERR